MSRYLVIAPQGLGDSLEATPLVKALRNAKCDAIIDVVVLRSQPRQLFEGLPELVSQVIYLPYWERGASAFITSLLRRRWRKTYDATFLCYPAARPEYQALAAAIPSRARYGFRYTATSLRSMLWLQTHLIDVRPVHNVFRNLDLLSAAGIPWETPEAYTVPAAWVATSERDPNLVVIHVGSIAHDGLESRRWPVGKFASVASELVNAGFHVKALMGPSEIRETEALRAAEPRVGLLQGELPDVARALSSAALVIANDNGIAHLASGVRTPTISLFGPTPLENAPFGPESRPMRPSACPPCFDVRLLNTACARGIDYACIRSDVRVNDVVRVALDVLRTQMPKALLTTKSQEGG